MTCRPPPHVSRNLLKSPRAQTLAHVTHVLLQRIDLEFTCFDKVRNVDLAFCTLDRGIGLPALWSAAMIRWAVCATFPARLGALRSHAADCRYGMKGRDLPEIKIACWRKSSTAATAARLEMTDAKTLIYSLPPSVRQRPTYLRLVCDGTTRPKMELFRCMLMVTHYILWYMYYLICCTDI